MSYFFILCFIALAVVFLGGGLIASRLLSVKNPNPIKGRPYECGEKTVGTSWVQFNVGYYVFALLFLVFDVESVFLYPWALAFRDFGFIGLLEVGLFIFILMVGLIYAWKKGVLEWL